MSEHRQVNGIAKTNPAHAAASKRGEELLESMGYR